MPDKPPCQHLRFRIRGSDPIRYVYCPDCRELVHILIAASSLVDKLRELVRAIEDAQKQLGDSSARPTP